jgi:HD-GYP domain-containing protein (c-di-GMP phosphodiesterase class II)
MGEPARLAELLGSLSLATDIAAGLPAETAIRTSLIAVRLGAAAGVQGYELHDVFYTGLLRFLGCSAWSYEMAQRFAAGDDLGLMRSLTPGDSRRPPDMLKRALRGIDRSAPLLERGKAFARFATSPNSGHELGVAHCELAVLLARKLGMSEGVIRNLGEIYERWDGRGAPAGIRGDAIRLGARLVHTAWRMAAHHALGGPLEAFETIAMRAGTEIDPALAKLVAKEGGSLVTGLDRVSAWSDFLEAEPRPRFHADAARTEELARVFAHFSDVKSPWTVGHSIAVASLVSASSGSKERLKLAALLHDVGRVAVPNGVWDKRGALDVGEREKMRAHSWETERILSRAPLWAETATLASMAHERLDGTGYHRKAAASGLDREARLLAAADVYAALTQDRPHRKAKTAAEAVDVLVKEPLCKDAIDEVLAAAGVVRGRRAQNPAALTDREIEIVRMVARGRANKEIAAEFDLSPSTVKRHLENIFGKVKLRTRAAIAVWALENDLLGD